MRSLTLRAYLALVVLAATVVLAAAGLGPYRQEVAPQGWLLLLLACVLSEALWVPLPRGGSVSLATIAHIAGALLLPPGPAATAAGLGILIDQMRRRKPLSRLLFNTASTTVTVGLSGMVAWAAGLGNGGFLEVEVPGVLGFLLVAGVYYAANNLLVAGVVALASREPLARVALANARFSAPAEFAVAVIGGLVAFVWVVGPAWLPLVLSPAVISHLTFHYLAANARKTEALEALNGLGRAVSSTLDPRATFAALWSRLGGQRGIDGLFLTLERPRLDLRAGAADDPSLADACASLGGRVMQEGQPLALGAEEARRAGLNVPAGGPTLAVAPMRGKRGALGVVVAPGHAFDAEDRHFLEVVAEWTVLALENSRLVGEAAEVEALREFDRLKTEFLSTVAHELRTPLSVIFGYAELLHRRGKRYSDAERESFAASIYEASGQMSRLVEDLLDMSRIERGQFAFDFQTLDLAPTLASLAEEFAVIAPSHQVEAALPTSLPLVRADVLRMRQVVSNLLTNAVRYSPPGSRVTLSAEADAEQVRIHVADTGVGIPPDELPRLFERFFRGSNGAMAPSQGVGLGLALVRQLVEAQGGTVEVVSQLGEGSTFTVSLPHADRAGRTAVPASGVEADPLPSLTG